MSGNNLEMVEDRDLVTVEDS